MPGQSWHAPLPVDETAYPTTAPTQAWELIMSLDRLPDRLNAVACGLLLLLLHVHGEIPYWGVGTESEMPNFAKSEGETMGEKRPGKEKLGEMTR